MRLLVVFVLFFCSVALAASKNDVINPELASQHKAEGDRLFKDGSFKQSIAEYTKAIKFNPTGAHYYKRGVVCAASSRIQQALADFTSAAELSPNFIPAFERKAKLLVRLGDFDEAIKELKAVKELDNTRDTSSMLMTISDLRRQFAHGEAALKSNNLPQARSIFDGLAEHSPDSIKLRFLRAELFEKEGEHRSVLQELNRALQVDGSNLEVMRRRGIALDNMGDSGAALAQFKECLKSDMENRPCRNAMKAVKAFNKKFEAATKAMDAENAESAIENFQEALNLRPDHPIYGPILNLALCKAYVKAGNGLQAVKTCSLKLQESPQDPEALFYRAEGHWLQEDYEQAARDFNNVNSRSDLYSKAQAKSQDAQAKHKQASRKDHYKTLDVPRDATNKQIKKAYRVLAQKWHPDKIEDKSEEGKILAEKKFREATEAYEVLTDEDKRRKHDLGQDVEDVNMGGGGGFGGGFPFGGFGGGGQKFHFRFN